MDTTGSHTKVALVKAKNHREGIRQSIDLIGINPVQGKKVVLKPNFNTADPYPGSTHPETLRELISYLQEIRALKITIGERSGPVGERSGPVKTAEVIESLGAHQIAEELGAELVNPAATGKTDF